MNPLTHDWPTEPVGQSWVSGLSRVSWLTASSLSSLAFRNTSALTLDNPLLLRIFVRSSTVCLICAMLAGTARPWVFRSYLRRRKNQSARSVEGISHTSQVYTFLYIRFGTVGLGVHRFIDLRLLNEIKIFRVENIVSAYDALPPIGSYELAG